METIRSGGRLRNFHAEPGLQCGLVAIIPPDPFGAQEPTLDPFGAQEPSNISTDSKNIVALYT